jgi:hypothetical protein
MTIVGVLSCGLSCCGNLILRLILLWEFDLAADLAVGI